VIAEAEDTQAGRREWIGLAVLAVPASTASLELTVTHLALPAIGASLAATSTQLLWIVDIYAFVLAGALITVGKLGDRIGRRRLLLVGAAAYGIASVLAAYATSPELLIAARAGMGLAGATLMPSTLSLIAVMFRSARQRAVAVSLIVASVSGGTAIGPLVGGWLLERYWWGSAFLLGVPVMVLLLAVGRALLPEHRADATDRLDVASAAMSLGAVLPLVYGLKQLAAGAAGWLAVVAVAVGVAFAWLFVHRQRRLDSPFVNLVLFRDRTFRVAIATLALGIFALWGLNVLVAQYLQLVQGLSPLEAGLWTAPSAVGVIVGSVLAPRLARVVRPAAVIGWGLVLSAVGFGVLTQVDGLALLLVATITVSAGLGPMMALATDQVIGAAPADQTGMAAALSSTAPQLGGALGIAALGSVVTWVYRNELVGAPPAARDNLAGAVTATDQLGAEVLTLAREAFVRGLHVTAAISAVLMLLTAALVLTNAAPKRRVPRRSRRSRRSWRCRRRGMR